jgi:hypothetical protein
MAAWRMDGRPIGLPLTVSLLPSAASDGLVLSQMRQHSSQY